MALINSGQIDYNDETKTSVRNALKAINLMNNNETSDRLKSANSGLSYDKEFADSTIADLKEFSSALEKSKQVPSYTDFLKNDPLDNLDSTQKFNVALAKLSTTTGNLAASAAKLPFVPFAYKVALGAGGLAIGAAGQTTLNKLDDAGITGRGGSQMNSRTDIGNFKAAGSTIKTGPDQASSLISQYLGTFSGKIPNNSAVQTQMRSDVIDLLNNPYIADDNKRKSMVDFYLDNPTYNTLFDKTNKVDAGGGNLSVSLRYAMEQLLTSASVSNRAKKMALGGVLAKDMNKIIPLDMAGQEFIRNQLESFSKNKDATIDINKKKDQKILTNIINETVYQTDNYEMYTIRQLTNGTLGAL